MNLKDLLFNKIFTLRRLFVAGNIILLVVFVLILVKDQQRGWKGYQSQFKEMEIARTQEKLQKAATDDERKVAEQELAAARNFKLGIHQIWNEKLDVVDRCITCHAGYDPLYNPSLTTDYKQQPFSAPADSDALDIHKIHNVEKFGCVICHGGQGLATEVKAAHGQVEHWESPLLTGTLIQASCAKCHDNVDELKVRGHVYTAEVVRAKTLIRENGCLGCHQIGGEGGPVSVDFREETSAKPLSRIDFTHTGLKGVDRTLANWIKLHLIEDPAKIVPGDPEAKFDTEPIAPSAMPPFLMPEKDANAITAFILGLNRNGLPSDYLVLRPKTVEPVAATPVERGRQVYEHFGCAGCHGADARGGIRNYNYLYDATPNLRRVVNTYSKDELKDKISHGVAFLAKLDATGPNPPIYMPSWKDKINDQQLDDLVSYLTSIREK